MDNCTIEDLEPRVLLAGNVIATYANGVLKVTGDDSGNELSIVIDLNTTITATFGTTINGGASAVFDVPTRSININLKGGGNELYLEGCGVIEIPVVDVKTSSAEGNFDTIEIYTLLGGSLKVSDGRADSVIDLDTVSMTKNLQIKAGRGQDSIILYSTGATETLSVKTGAGTTSLEVTNVSAGLLSLKGGLGNTVKFFGSEFTDPITTKGYTLENTDPFLTDTEEELLAIEVPSNALNGNVFYALSPDDAEQNDISFAFLSGNEAGIFSVGADGNISIANEVLLGPSSTVYDLRLELDDGYDYAYYDIRITVVTP